MRKTMYFYLFLSVFYAGCFLSDYCLAQTLKSEDANLKTAGGRIDQTETVDLEDADVIRIETTLIVSDILVFDKNGKPVKDLKKDDFIVKEDGQLQEINTLSFGDNEALPRSVVLVIDFSGSQLPYIQTSIEAAKVLVDKLPSRDRMAIVTDNVELLQDFTNDKSLLKEKLESLRAGALAGKLGGSRQYSALMAVLKDMLAENGFRPIIIFQTDGDELDILKGGRTSLSQKIEFGFEDVLSATERTRATIYSIIPGVRFYGIPESEFLERSKQSTMNAERAFSELRRRVFKPEKLSLTERSLRFRAESYNRQQSALCEIARQTGGSTYFLERPEEAEKVYSEIFSEINLRYLIGYYPSNQARNGKRRSVSIELPRHPEYKILGRKTYILDEK